MLLPSIPGALWPRLGASLIVLVLARFAVATTHRSDLRPLLFASMALVLRDAASIVLSALAPDFVVVARVAGETVAYVAFVRWTGLYRRGALATRLTALLALVGWMVVGLGLIASGPEHLAARVGLYVLPPIVFGASASALFLVDPRVFVRGHEIERFKPWGNVALVLQFIGYAVVPLRTQAFFGGVTLLPLFPIGGAILFLVARTIRDERARTHKLRDNARAIFGFLSGVGQSLGGGRDPEKILNSAVTTMVEATMADSGIAILTDSGRPRVTSVVGLYPPPVAVPPIVKTKQGALRRFLLSLEISQSIPLWGPAVWEGRGTHIKEASEHPAVQEHAQDRVLRLRSLLVLPLRARNHTLGVLSVARRGDAEPFSGAEYDHARTMANFVAVTLDNYYNYRVQRDVEIAADIQRRLQAPPSLRNGGVWFAGMSRAARGVSGDYFDVIPLGDNRTAVVVCDVSGKGVPAALVMVMVRTIAHLALTQTDDAGRVLEMMNSGLCGAIDIDRFATVSLVIFRPDENLLSYANAAHHPAVVVHHDQATVEHIDAEGLPIGVETAGGYPSREVEFSPGDSLVLFTDGVIEAFNAAGEVFGESRLHSALNALAERPLGESGSDEILYTLMSRVDEFAAGAPQHDDMTMLVCSFLSSAS